MQTPTTARRGPPPADQSSPPPGQHEKAQPQRSFGITPSTAAGWPTTPRNHSFRVSSTATGRCLLTCGRLFARTPPRVSATVCNRRGVGGAATSSGQPPECHLAAKFGGRRWVRTTGFSLVSVVPLAGNQGNFRRDLRKPLRQGSRKSASIRGYCRPVSHSRASAAESLPP